MKPLLIKYDKCGTCRKASKWLKENGVEVELREMLEDNPTKEELSLWVTKSKLPIRKFFNTSGVRYKELGLKDKVLTASNDELLSLLASDGRLVKRPILVAGNCVLLGFDEATWRSYFWGAAE